MKTKIFLLMCAMAIGIISYGLNVKVISYNIRYNNPEDGINAWPERKEAVIQLIRFHEADVFGLQEALLDQINDIASQMPGFDWAGVGREDGINKGEHTPIFFNSQKYQLKEQGWFWLSETPDAPDKGWDAALPRICTYVLLEDYDTRKSFWVFNTHFDHIGKKARKESAKFILRKIDEKNKNKLPVILMGDFNSTPDDDPVKIIKRRLEDSKEFTTTAPYGPEGTFNGFDFNSPLKERIDYIFVNKRVPILKYAVLTDSKDRRYPSDHLPVFVEISF